MHVTFPTVMYLLISSPVPALAPFSPKGFPDWGLLVSPIGAYWYPRLGPIGIPDWGPLVSPIGAHWYPRLGPIGIPDWGPLVSPIGAYWYPQRENRVLISVKSISQLG